MDRFVRLLKEPHFSSFGFDFNIQVQARKATGTFEKRVLSLLFLYSSYLENKKDNFNGHHYLCKIVSVSCSILPASKCPPSIKPWAASQRDWI